METLSAPTPIESHSVGASQESFNYGQPGVDNANQAVGDTFLSEPSLTSQPTLENRTGNYSQDFVDREVSTNMATFDQDLTAMLDKETGSEVGEQKKGRLRALGRAAMIRTGLEVAGGIVDTIFLMGAGAGIAPLTSVVGREALATAGDVAVLDKIQGGEEVAGPELRRKRVGRKLGNLAVGVGTAIVAQKVGLSAFELVAPHVDGGAIHEYAVPIASKVGALAGVNAARSRMGV